MRSRAAVLWTPSIGPSPHTSKRCSIRTVLRSDLGTQYASAISILTAICCAGLSKNRQYRRKKQTIPRSPSTPVDAVGENAVECSELTSSPGRGRGGGASTMRGAGVNCAQCPRTWQTSLTCLYPVPGGAVIAMDRGTREVEESKRGERAGDEGSV